MPSKNSNGFVFIHTITLHDTRRYHDPEFGNAMRRLRMHAWFYAVPSLTTLFAEHLPNMESVLKVWDVLFSAPPCDRRRLSWCLLLVLLRVWCKQEVLEAQGLARYSAVKDQRVYLVSSDIGLTIYPCYDQSI